MQRGRPEPQALPDAASRQNSLGPACRGYFDVRQGRQGRGDGSVRTDFLWSRRPLRRLTARINRADASVADVCWCSRQSNFRAKLLTGTRPEPQVLPDAASRQNSPTGNLAFSPAACTLPPINIRVCYAANAVAGIFYEHHVPGERAFYVHAAQGGRGGG